MRCVGRTHGFRFQRESHGRLRVGQPRGDLSQKRRAGEQLRALASTPPGGRKRTRQSVGQPLPVRRAEYFVGSACGEKSSHRHANFTQHSPLPPRSGIERSGIEPVPPVGRLRRGRRSPVRGVWTREPSCPRPVAPISPTFSHCRVHHLRVTYRQPHRATAQDRVE